MKAKIVYVALAFLVAVVLMLAAVPIAATDVAFAQVTLVYISPSSQTVSPGQVFTVDVYVEPAEPISGVQAALSFDPSLLTANSVTEGGLLNQGGTIPTFFIPGTINDSAGTIYLIGCTIFGAATVSDPGTFVTISFTAKEAIDTSPLHLYDVKVVLFPDIERVTVETDGSVTIEEEAPPEEEGGCFIATAAYGTSTAVEIDVLRAFRDGVLLESTLGSQLVEWYYQVSPPVADFISEHDVLRTLVRELLVDPVAWLVDAVWSVDAIWVVDVNWVVDAIETLWRD